MKFNIFITNVSNRKDDKHSEAIIGELEQIQDIFEENEGIKINLFHKNLITAGKEVNKEIEFHLNNANIVLLLFSRDFLTKVRTNPPLKKEFNQIIGKHNNGEARVIPIILRQCLWEESFFGCLSPLPPKGKPINKYTDKDEAYYETATGIIAVIKEEIKKFDEDNFSKDGKVIPINKNNRIKKDDNSIVNYILREFFPVKAIPI